MIIDGEKFACEACVRGHRVSNCQHSNRPLQHINKKGRPVSQCAHCRSMRKSRTAHVKCDCGEKTSKCIHLQPPSDGHLETCCCNHGGRCTCAGKKEPPLDTVPESDSDVDAQKQSMVLPPKPVMRRRRANTIHSSDLGMSFDQNGNHKPSKHNRLSQKCGPYSLNRVNSATSAGSLGSGTESLMYQASVDGHNAARSFGIREQRQVKSETASPLMSATSFAQLNSNLPPLDLSSISDYSSYVGSANFDLFSGGLPSEEGPLLSAGLTRSVDWSHYDLRDNGDTFTPSSYSQAGTQSFTGQLDFGSGSEALPHLAGTTSTSGDVSEVEDWLPGGDGDLDGFDTSTFLRQGNATDLSSIDYTNFFKSEENSTVSHAFLDDDPAFFIPNYNNGIAAVEESPDSLGTSSLNNYWDM